VNQPEKKLSAENDRITKKTAVISDASVKSQPADSSGFIQDLLPAYQSKHSSTKTCIPPFTFPTAEATLLALSVKKKKSTLNVSLHPLKD
jgi:hypothetical protein